MPPEKTEIEKFFGDLPSEDQQPADIFGEDIPEAPKAPEEGAGEEGAPAKDDEPRKNRRHRRLEQQLQVEREARIRAEALAAARAELPARGEESIDERLVRLYGAENVEAQRLTQAVIDDAVSKAEERAIARMRKEADEAAQEQTQFEAYIDSELEAIEDEHNVDLTSDAPAARKARREFKELVQKLSPKDENGYVKDFADFQEVWDIYQNQKAVEKPDSASRAKEIAARTMQKSGGAAATPPTPTPGFRGWMRDFNVNPE